MSAMPGPVASERLLEVRRVRSVLTVDLVQWVNGRFSVSLGFTPLSTQNPGSMTRYVSVDPHELSSVIDALEKGRARIAQEQTREATT